MWTPPGQDPSAPAYGPPTAARELTRVPIWERQPDETARAWAAFSGWLTSPGNWAEACARISGEPAEVEALSRAWSWPTRRLAREAAVAGPARERATLEARGRIRDSIVLDVEILEWRKLYMRAHGLESTELAHDDPLRAPPVLETRQLISLLGKTGSLEVQRRRAGILERLASDVTQAAIDFSRLSDAEMEMFRKIRAKATA